ncbi:MAG: radical SAM family heme chaperone HemW [Anaerolineae bacterium]|nr:radical SAM family heme chaperone HemW [Thermoflexales bacterium]MDW8406723.1 radical SAM family heme chaperone HemW [Anaerolineae bacterium]
MRSLGLYLHIPFCRSRCTYCDFNTYVGMEDLRAPYVQALCREIRAAAQSHALNPIADSPRARPTATTIFFGGGTPSILPPAQLAGALRACYEAFDIPPSAEVTVECNPGTVDVDYLRALRSEGVNRLSFGAQTADPNELKMLGREHGFEDVIAAIEASRAAGFDNVSFDLIFGLPHQTLDSWRRTLQVALPLQPDHISLYALTIERGTPLHDQVRRGETPLPDPDAAADMYDLAEDVLGAAGYIHYEISNWCKPGQACAHNLIYWRNEPYFGFGAGAHSSSIRRRWWNVRRPAEYISRLARGESPQADGEDIDERASRGETMVMGLRLLEEGVSYERFASRHGVDMRLVFAESLRAGQEKGLLDMLPDRVRLTRKGRFLSNQVMSAFV